MRGERREERSVEEEEIGRKKGEYCREYRRKDDTKKGKRRIDAKGKGNWMKGEERKEKGVKRTYEGRGGSKEEKRGWRRRKKVDERSNMGKKSK